jgi:hypothetical protein
VLQQLKSLAQELHGKDTHIFLAYAKAISTQIQRVEQVWVELEDIVQSVRGPIKTKLRNEKWMKKSEQVARLQERLHKIRFGTLEMLSSYSLLVDLFWLPLIL